MSLFYVPNFDKIWCGILLLVCVLVRPSVRHTFYAACNLLTPHARVLTDLWPFLGIETSLVKLFELGT